MSPFASPRSAAHQLRHLLILTLVIGLIWMLLESLVFRTGFYYRHWVEPNSNAGTTALSLRLARRNATLQPPTVLVLGDSRVGMGFSPAVAQDTAPGFNFINVAVPGSKPRTWYYLLRAMVRKQVPFKLVVVGLVYPPMGAGNWPDWPLDPAFMAPLVDLRDAGEFPASFSDPAVRRQAQEAIWLPALLMQKDIQNLLSSPSERREHLEAMRWRLDNIGSWRGREGVMPELTFGPDRRVLDWKDATPEQRAALETHLRVLSQTAPDHTDYTQFWFGKLLELIRENDAQLIFYPLPRGPYAQILPPQNVAPLWLTDLQKAPDVTVLAPDFLADLEAPEYFVDALHANSTARVITAERVAHAVASLLPGLGPEVAPESSETSPR